MTARSRAFAAFAFLFLLTTAAAAAPIELKVLFDDDNDTATGCSVNGVSGVERILLTRVETDAPTRVTSAATQTCTAGVLGAASVFDAAGWPAVFDSSSGALTVESRLARSVFGPGPRFGFRVAFIAESGSLTNSLATDVHGNPIRFPVARSRRRLASIAGPNRVITLDGVTTDWVGIGSLAEGSGQPDLRFVEVFGFFDEDDLYFRFEAQASPGAPTAVDDAYQVDLGNTLTVAAPGVLANDSDPLDRPLTATLVTTTVHGSVVLNADGSFTYANDGTGVVDEFAYRADNGDQLSNIARAAITIGAGANTPPVGVADTYQAGQGGTLEVFAPGVLSNDTDANGDALTARLGTAPQHGTITLNGNGSFTYQNDGTPGADTFTYFANDGLADSAEVTVTINVAANVPPTAVANTYTVAEGGTLNVAAPGPLANDIDPDTPIEFLSIVAATLPLHGTLSIGANGQFTYVHDGSETTTDTFSYRALDEFSSSNVATITIIITPVNDLPVAGADAYATNEDTPLTVVAPGVLGNDTDGEGAALNAVLVTNGTGGSVVLNPDGSFTYTPNADFNGTDTFTYSANDGTASSLPATVTITVNAVNDPPAFTGSGDVTVLEDSGAFSATWATSISAGPANEAAQTLSFGVSNDNTALFAVQPSIAPNGTLTFTPAANLNGSALVSVTLTDSGSNVAPNANSTGVVTFTINVTAVNDVPSFAKGADLVVLDTDGAQTVTGWATALSAGPANESAQVLDFIVSNDNNAVFSAQPSIAADGTLTFTPLAGAFGLVTVTVSIHDNAGTANGGVDTSAAQTFTIDVQKVPVITSGNAVTFTVGSPGTFTVTTSGRPLPSLSEGGTLPAGVTFVDNGDGTGTLSGTPGTGTGGTYALTFTATNVRGSSGPQSFTLTVNEAPAITSANADSFVVGTLRTFDITTSGFPAVSAITLTSGSVPSGLSFIDDGDGTARITGTAADGTGGTYNLQFTATNGVAPDAVQSFTLTVNESPEFTSVNADTFQIGTARTFDITTTGFPAATISLTGGSLPSGLSFINDGDGTARITGTAAAGTGGTYNLELTASNGVSPDAVQGFTLTVNQPPSFTSANAATFQVGTLQTFDITTQGFPTITTITSTGGPLPGGLSFIDDGDGTARITGTPDLNSGGSYALQFTATNGVAPDAVQDFTLVVNEPPVFTSADNDTFTIGVDRTFDITTDGFPAAATISVTGALPDGITFINDGDGTARFTGTAAVGSGGTYNLQITASNGVAPDAVQNFTLTVSLPPSFTSADSDTFIVGTDRTFDITTNGVPTVTSITLTSGGLPSGLTFTDDGDGTARIHGTAADDSGATYTLEFTATNGVLPDAVQTFTLTVNEAPEFTSADNATFSVGTAESFAVTTQGFPASSIVQTGDTLPTGLTFVDNGDGTATLAGTAAPGGAGTYNLIFTASNGVGSDAVQNFTLTVTCPAISFTPAAGALTAGTFNVAYSQTFALTGPAGPYTWSVAAGSLPGGINIDTTTGEISGTPSATGAFSFTIRATQDASGCYGENAYTLDIRPDAVDDSYGTAGGNEAVGNTQVVVAGHSSPTTPFVAFAGAISANDQPAGSTIVTVTNAPTTAGGLITIDAAGAFTYTPPAGFTGDDTYTYTLTSNGVSDTGLITIRLADVIWYVNPAAGAGDGRSNTPFNTLAGAVTASSSFQTIYVHQGAATGPVLLKSDQTLHGSGRPFTLRGLSIPATVNPVLDSTVTLASQTVVRGLTISNATGFALASSGSLSSSIVDFVTITGLGGISFTGAANGTLNVTNSSINVSGPSSAVSLTGGDASLGFTDTSVSGNGGTPILVTGTTGGLLVFGNNSPVTATGTTGPGISINNNTNRLTTFAATSPVTVTGGATAGILFATNSAASSITFNGSVSSVTVGVPALLITGNASGQQTTFNSAKTFTATNANAVTITGNEGTVSFQGAGNLALTTIASGTALQVDKGVLVGSGPVQVTGSNNNINAAGTALDLSDQSSGTYTFATTNSNGGTRNINLSNLTFGPSITLGSGTLQGGTSEGVTISGGTTGMTFSGTLTNAVGAVHVTSHAIGTVTFSGTVTANGGTGLLFENADGSYNFTGTTTLSNTAAIEVLAGVDATNGSQGTFAFGSGASVTSTSAAAVGPLFNIQSSKPNFTYSGSFSRSGFGETAISIANNQGGTILFDGVSPTETKSLNTTSASAINLDNNDNCTISFTQGGLAITTTSGTGFRAVNGGTVVVSGTVNTINSTSGVALNVTSTNIGIAGLTFQSISASGGANGILLSSTGTTAGTHGGLTVVGTGSAGTGGTIQNTSGSGVSATSSRLLSLSWMNLTNANTVDGGVAGGTCDLGNVSTCNGAVDLTNVTGVTLTRVAISGGEEQGVVGSNVTDFSMTNSSVLNVGDEAAENGVYFIGLYGTVNIASSTFSGNAFNNFGVLNTSGSTPLNMSVTGSTFSSNSAIGGDGLVGDFRGGTNTSMTVTGNTFTANKDDHFNVVASSNAVVNVLFGGAGALANTLSGGHPSPTGQGIALRVGGSFSGTYTFEINNNTINGAIPTAINTGSGTMTSTGLVKGKIINNKVGTSGSNLSGSAQGSCILAEANGLGSNGTVTVLIDSNTLRQCFDKGIDLLAGRDGDNCSSGACTSHNMNATVTNNNVNELTNASSRWAIRLETGSSFGTETSNVCADISNNTLFAQTIGDEMSIRQRSNVTIRLPGFAGAVNDDTAVETYLQGRNAAGGTAAVTHTLATNFQNTSPPGSACPQP